MMKNILRSTSICLTGCLMGGLLMSAASVAGDEYGSKSKEDAHFKMMDSNMDGKVSAAEHTAGAKMMFDKMDANKDGKVTATEMDAGSKAMMGSKDMDSKSMDSKDSAGMKHDGSHKMMSSAEKIKTMDKDGDGALSAQEHAAGSRSMFGKMDADKDGNLTAAEVKAGHEKMMTAHDE